MSAPRLTQGEAALLAGRPNYRRRVLVVAILRALGVM